MSSTSTKGTFTEEDCIIDSDEFFQAGLEQGSEFNHLPALSSDKDDDALNMGFSVGDVKTAYNEAAEFEGNTNQHYTFTTDEARTKAPTLLHPNDERKPPALNPKRINNDGHALFQCSSDSISNKEDAALSGNDIEAYTFNDDDNREEIITPTMITRSASRKRGLASLDNEPDKEEQFDCKKTKSSDDVTKKKGKQGPNKKNESKKGSKYRCGLCQQIKEGHDCEFRNIHKDVLKDMELQLQSCNLCGEPNKSHECKLTKIPKDDLKKMQSQLKHMYECLQYVYFLGRKDGTNESRPRETNDDGTPQEDECYGENEEGKDDKGY